MRDKNVHAWGIVERQHGVITRAQLLALGFTTKAIAHRIARGRLHPLWRGVYAVGRPEITQRGRWMAAVLACGPKAVLSHSAAAALWGFGPATHRIEVSVPAHLRRSRPGISVHRRRELAAARRDGIPVTTVEQTLLDLVRRLSIAKLERAINEADRLDLIEYDRLPGQLIDRRIFKPTDSELERRFLRLAKLAGLPPPLTGRLVNGFKVDFYWPDQELVVETDGLRYHRTPAQQARDRLRDQAHATVGTTPLRFTYAQVLHEREYVVATLKSIFSRLPVDFRGRRS